MDASRRHRGMIRWLAFWRRSPGSPHGAGAFHLLAIFGLVLPLLVAVATQYTTQIVPDFDDYDSDGPDDDAWDEKKSSPVWMPHDPGSHRTPNLASLPRGSVSLFHPKACETRMEDLRPQMLSITLGDPLLARGPPRPKDTDREPDPSSAGRGTRHSDHPDLEHERTGSVDGSRKSPPQPQPPSSHLHCPRLTGVKGALRAPRSGLKTLDTGQPSARSHLSAAAFAAAAYQKQNNFLGGRPAHSEKEVGA